MAIYDIFTLADQRLNILDGFGRRPPPQPSYQAKVDPRMIHDYKGNYVYSQKVITDWNSTAMGVYYCGIPNPNGTLKPLYIGVGTSDGGMRSRLLDHLRDDNWPDVTHFGYCACDTTKEAEDFEAAEIKRCQPKYNLVGKTVGRTW